MAGWVFLEGGCDDQGLPVGIGVGERVAVGVGLLDRGDRPPGVVVVLGVPDRDHRVGHGELVWARSRAASVSRRCLVLIRVSATRSQIATGAWDCHSSAVWPSKGLRRLLVALPRVLTSAKSCAYRALASGGGAGGRNCEGELIANGVMLANCRNAGGPNSGGVGCHRPGVSVGWYGGGTAVKPSPARQARIVSATVAPQVTPRRIASESCSSSSASRASVAASSVSKLAAWLGNSADSASCAAPAAAAAGSAFRGAAVCTWKGSYRRVIPSTASNTDAWTMAPTRIAGGGGVCVISSAPIIAAVHSVMTGTGEMSVSSASAEPSGNAGQISAGTSRTADHAVIRRRAFIATSV